MKAILVGNGTMGGRHRGRFELCGVNFVAVADTQAEFDGIVDKLNLENADGKSAGVDFAVIASPATTHYDYAKFFLERHIPVFVEKPLATTAEQAQELVDMAAASGTVLFVAQSECFNPIFLNFRKHFVAELNARMANNEGGAGVRLDFRREHQYSSRCRDVNVMLDLLVHDLSMFLTMFRAEDVKMDWLKTGKKASNDEAEFDSAMMRLRVVSGEYRGVIADFYVNRKSNCDMREIAVEFPKSRYTVSLAHYNSEGEVEHVPDSLDNEHRFFLKLLAGACTDWGRRAAQNAADCVKMCGGA
jgi:predicted dehydrogenase